MTQPHSNAIADDRDYDRLLTAADCDDTDLTSTAIEVDANGYDGGMNATVEDCRGKCGEEASIDPCDICAGDHTENISDDDLDGASDCYRTAYRTNCGCVGEQLGWPLTTALVVSIWVRIGLHGPR